MSQKNKQDDKLYFIASTLILMGWVIYHSIDAYYYQGDWSPLTTFAVGFVPIAILSLPVAYFYSKLYLKSKLRTIKFMLLFMFTSFVGYIWLMFLTFIIHGLYR